MGQLLSAMATTKLNTSQLPGRLFWHNDLSFWMPDTNPHYGAAVAGAGDLNDDGYTNIEDFIHGLDPRAPKRNWVGNRTDPRCPG